MADRTQWLYERDFNCRGQREDAYTATNGEISSATTNSLLHWDPSLKLANLTPTQETTLIALHNMDNIVVPNSNVYGQLPLNRPIIVDEIGIKLLKDSTSNFFNYDLAANVLWLDHMDTTPDYGTCSSYWMNNLNTDEGYGGGSLDTGRVTFQAIAWTGAERSQPGDIIDGLTSHAQLTITVKYNDADYLGVMTNATNFILGENAAIRRGGMIIGNLGNCLAFTRYSDTMPDGDRLRWGVDRLYNASVGPTEQPNEQPTGHGPNAIVAYADADGELVDWQAERILVPLIQDGTGNTGIYRPPKDSFIIDPGQAIVVSLHSLIVPPPWQYWSATWHELVAVGAPYISCWVKFRQPMIQEVQFVLTGRTDVI